MLEILKRSIEKVSVFNLEGMIKVLGNKRTRINVGIW
jgi:hypothetical protein